MFSNYNFLIYFVGINCMVSCLAFSPLFSRRSAAGVETALPLKREEGR